MTTTAVNDLCVWLTLSTLHSSQRTKDFGEPIKNLCFTDLDIDTHNALSLRK
jgi:hypothetical protein